MKETQKMIKYIKQNGITLIALVVTIVVLMILAGVSISLLTGEQGIIKQALNAKVITRVANIEEEIALWKAENEMRRINGRNLITEEEFINVLINEKGILNEEEIWIEDHYITIEEYEIDYGEYSVRNAKDLGWDYIVLYDELSEKPAYIESAYIIKDGNKIDISDVIQYDRDNHYYYICGTDINIEVEGLEYQKTYTFILEQYDIEHKGDAVLYYPL